MGLPWIQVAKEFPKSPEAIALGHALGVGRHAAVGMAAEFWAWAADHAPDGRVDGALATLVVDEAVGWRGPKSFAEAMTESGLMEKDERGLRIVGWDRYADALRRAAESAERSRNRRRTRSEPEPNAERTQTERKTNAVGTQTELHKSQSQNQTEIQKEAAAAPKENLPRVVEPPTAPPDTWTGSDFERWAQSRRQAAGLVPEKHHPPGPLATWFNAATMTPGVTVAALKAGFLAFGADAYWEKQGFPFRAFVSQWDKYTRKESKRAATG